MRITLIAEIATIIGSAMILLTLMFAIIQLRKNVDQALTATIITRSQQYRVRAFLKYDGAMKCYEHLVSENVIPTVWQKAIQPALE